MEEQLSLMELVVNASITVQLVMALLVLASMFSWYMIINRFIYFRNARSEMYLFEDRFWSGIDLAELYREGNEKASDGHSHPRHGEYLPRRASRSSPGSRSSRRSTPRH